MVALMEPNMLKINLFCRKKLEGQRLLYISMFEVVIKKLLKTKPKSNFENLMS